MARRALAEAILTTGANRAVTVPATSTLRVRERGGTALATIYSASTGGTALPNPLTVTNGMPVGYVENGSYDLMATASGVSSESWEWEALVATSVVSDAEATGNQVAYIDPTSGRYAWREPDQYNVVEWGATGDGSTDDTDDIQAAIDAAHARGGGIVFFRPGTYLVSWRENPSFAGYWIAVRTYKDVILKGAGRGLVTIKLAANQPRKASAAIIRNHDLDGGANPDTNIVVEDLTVDGNAYNQVTRVTAGGTMTNGSGVLTRASGSFTSADVGKAVVVAGAGAAGAFLSTTIASYQSATQVTLTDNAATSVSGADFDYGGLYQGISWTRVIGATCQRVDVKNVYGTNPFPPGETFHFDASNSARCRWIDCNAYADDNGRTGSGFSANSSTDVAWVNCLADSMSHGMGFTIWYCSQASYAACTAIRNHTHGFNCEYSKYVSYAACHSGNTSAAQDATPFSSNTVLGNTASGFCLNTSDRVTLTACSAANNGGAGLSCISLSGNCRVVGGDFMSNATGIYTDSTATSRLLGVSRETRVESNTSNNNWELNGYVGIITGLGRRLTDPSVPATTVAATNSYPFDVNVYITDGSVTDVKLGSSTNLGPQTAVQVSPGQNITLTYTGSPTWKWMRA